MHFTQNCPSLSTGAEYPPEQVNAFDDYRKPTSGPFAETYNPGWRNHPNFSWKQNQPQNQGGTSTQTHNQYPFGFPSQAQNQFRSSHQAQPPAFQSTTQVPPPEPQSSFEDTVKAFIQVSSQNIQGLNQTVQELKTATMSNSQTIQELKNEFMDSKQFTHQAIAKMEAQIGQLANQMGEREKGKFPSQPMPNLKGQFVIGGSSASSYGQDHVQAITTLRSGKQVDNQVAMPKEATEAAKDEENHEKPGRDLGPDTVIPIAKESLQKFVPKAPFPKRLKAPKKGSKFDEILEVFKQVQINIPFLDAIQQVPSYAKFLKDLVTIKRRTNVPKKAFLTEQVSYILQCKIPVKYKDPGCPTIACMIGDNKVERALLDLGASVNLLPYSVYVQLGLGELKPTSVTLQLADISVKVPRGIIEDVLIKVDKFYYPVDFIVLDTEPVMNVEIQIPVILGRPFLATANALINCRTGVMKLSFGNMTVELNIFDISRQPF
jgi:hypothetical protein